MLQAQTSRQEEKSQIPESCLQQTRGSPAGDAGWSREHRGRDQGLKAALESPGNPGSRRSMPGPKTQAMPRAVQCSASGTRGTLDPDPRKPLEPGVVPKRPQSRPGTGGGRREQASQTPTVRTSPRKQAPGRQKEQDAIPSSPKNPQTDVQGEKDRRDKFRRWRKRMNVGP